MVNHKVLEALEKVDGLIKEELKQPKSYDLNAKDRLREARTKVQEAITYILKGA